MRMPISTRRVAQVELKAAARYYEKQKAGLGDQRISAVPKLHQIIYQDIRRAPVEGYPYGVYYRVLPRRIVVIAIVHSSRDPSVWQGRV